MAEKAKKVMDKAEKKEKKKRKSKDKGPADKKQKTSKGSVKLEKVQQKDAEARSEKKAIFVQPENLAEDCVLKDYQLEGVRWLASLFENGVSGILADGTCRNVADACPFSVRRNYAHHVKTFPHETEMGLGKTIQCIALIAHLLMQDVSGPFIIVAPLATLPNWVREFEKWLPGKPVVRYHGAAAEREALLRGPLNYKFRKNTDYPFIVTSYEVAIRDQSKLERISEFTYLIVDEGHRLKNHRCTLLSSLKRLKAANRLLLTGYVLSFPRRSLGSQRIRVLSHFAPFLLFSLSSVLRFRIRLTSSGVC
jgi:ATP-dependent DNA helicase